MASTKDFLSIQSATAGPPPAPSYAGLVKTVLKYRQKRVYILAFAGTAVLLPLATFPVAGLDAILAWLYPTAWAVLLLGWVSTLPVFVARKQYLSATPAAHKDRISAYYALLTLRAAKFTFLAYSIGAALFTSAYVFMLTWLVPTRSYLALTRTPGRDLIAINERCVYIAVCVLASTATYAIRQILANRQILRFDAEQHTLASRLQARLSKNAPACLATAVSSNFTALGLYLLLKRSALRFIIYRIPGGRILRPYLLSMLRANHVTASLILAALSASISFLLLVELANSLADVYYSQPMLLSAYSADPRGSLVNGLRDGDPYIRRFAYLELAQVCSSDASRRIDMFTDIKTHTYEAVVKECLLQLGRSYRNLQGRGGNPRSAAPLAARATGTGGSASPQDSHRIPIAKEPAFAPSRLSGLEKIASWVNTLTGSQSSPSQTGTAIKAALVAPSAASALASVPPILQRRLPDAVKTAATTVDKKVENAQAIVQRAEKTVFDRFEALTPRSIAKSAGYKHLFDAQIAADVARCLPNADLDKSAAIALGSLLMASIKEDQYGVAQADIAKVLEAFVLYMKVVDGYIVELKQSVEKGLYAQGAVETTVHSIVRPLSEGTLCIQVAGP